MVAKKIIIAVSLPILLAGSFFGGTVYLRAKENRNLEIQKKKYAFIAYPDLGLSSDIILDFTNIRNQVRAYVDKNIGKDNSSIFFQYLPTGTSFGYGETREFTGASLLKLPFVMNLYRLAEQDKVNLDQKVSLKKEWLNDEYGELYKKGEGYQLTYREAARLALKDSDNTAILMIFDVLSKSGMTADQEVVNYLDANFKVASDNTVQIGAQSYSSVLKCLYFSCYLKLDDSQELLTYMTESSFNDRLTANTPGELKVAHKIGTFSTEVQSDCGIFYVPNRNYVLCIMLKESDPGGSEHIAAISKMVYDYVTKVQPGPGLK